MSEKVINLPDYIPAQTNSMKCVSCNLDKGFTQRSDRVIEYGPFRMPLTNMPSAWPGRHSGKCFECGQGEYKAKTGSFYFSTKRDLDTYNRWVDNVEAQRLAVDEEE